MSDKKHGGYRPGSGRKPVYVHIRLSERDRRDLARAAQKYGMTPAEIAERIIVAKLEQGRSMGVL